MQKAISDTCDRGRPAVLEAPRGDLAGLYEEISGRIVREIERIENGAIISPEVTFEEGRGILFSVPDGDERVIDPADLRRRCGCARCKDEYTGEPLLRPEEVPDDVHPLSIERMGNYAVAIRWSDGHDSSIYPYEKL